MRIILIFTYGISLRNWHETGIYEREMLFYQKLEEKYNISFTFLTYGDKSDEDYFYGFSNSRVLPVYAFINKSRFKKVNLIKSIFIPFKLSKKLNESDLIKTNQLDGSWVAIILKKILKIPLIVRTGYNIYEFKQLEGKSIYKKLFYKNLTKLALMYSDLFTTTSNTDKTNISKLKKINKNIEVIPNWIYEVYENPVDQRYQNKILTVGRLEEQKNYQSLIESFQGLNIEIDIVGEGSQKSELEKLAQRTGVSVNFLGTFNFFELNRLYSKYKVFVSTSNFEGNPKVILEALASGCVVIAKNTPNLRDVIENKNTGFLYDDSKDISKLVNKVLLDDNIFTEVSDKGLSKVKNSYHLSSILQKEVSNYIKLIN
jgi:glycosyltransferase involved in cell wall biosynthesis